MRSTLRLLLLLWWCIIESIDVDSLLFERLLLGVRINCGISNDSLDDDGAGMPSSSVGLVR
jgi:hypothetical protein